MSIRTLKQTNERVKVKKEVNRMEGIPSDVTSTYCYFDLYAACAKGLSLPNDAICGKCVAAAHAEIVRRNDNGTQ